MHRLACVSIRRAGLSDLDELNALAAASMCGLCEDDYTPTQIGTLLRFGLGPDALLVADGTYYIIEDAGRIIAAGGWSQRAALFGHTHPNYEGDPHDPYDLLDPSANAARLRGLFVHPDAARQGLGRTLLALCERTAAAAGYARLELIATPAARRLCLACGFADVERMTNIFPNCVAVPGYRMAKAIGPGTLNIPAGVASSDPYPIYRPDGAPRPPSLN
jgi:GNAT superfamily N-acetyltransferase